MAQIGTAFYTGLYRHTLDDKGRVTIPSSWRSTHSEAESFLATPQPGGYIAVLPPSEAEKMHAKMAAVTMGDGAAQDWAALYFSEAQTFTFDKQGRVMLDSGLLAHAGIVKDAVLVGSMNKFNIYSPSHWDKIVAARATDKSEVMRRLGI